MKTTTILRVLLFVLIIFWVSPKTGYSQVRLPALIRDSMVLQRDTKIKIWGWAAKAEKVTIQFNGKSFKTVTAPDGKWIVWIPPMKAGGPYSMNITASNKIVLNNILMGDVWICSGQSNMVHQMELHNITYADEIANAHYPEIRHFFIPTLTDLTGPKDELPAGYWKSANPTDVNRFSAVAYFFAKAIYEKYHVPIGLVNASVGGTPVEAWISEEGLKGFSNITDLIQKNKDTAYVNGVNRIAMAASAKRPKIVDQGLAGPLPWYDTAFVPKNWQIMNIPGYWEDQGIRDLDGVVWYRKEIDVPVSMTGMPAKVFLGRIVDADFLYINGVQAGNTGYQYPQRRYSLPANLLKPGKNIFVIRVINNSGKGGFVPGKPYSIIAGGQTIDLKGYWQYKVGSVFKPETNHVNNIAAQNQPSALFNAMISPLINYGIKGILWYQGEANAGQPNTYSKLLSALIADWRHQWKQDSVPFLYVQLPNFMEANYLPSQSQWAMIREAQLQTLSVPNTGMAVAIDLGEWNDIHPDNKKEVGLRLALAAEKTGYGEKDMVGSPVYQKAIIDKNKIKIYFSDTGSGLMAVDGEPLRQFAIAGPDKKFVWAEAIIEADHIVVWNDQLPNPAYVRYAWADNPEGANLYNREGLPASPFRTDTGSP
jgi:sialate O-acetylesterase